MTRYALEMMRRNSPLITELSEFLRSKGYEDHLKLAWSTFGGGLMLDENGLFYLDKNHDLNLKEDLSAIPYFASIRQRHEELAKSHPHPNIRGDFQPSRT